MKEYTYEKAGVSVDSANLLSNILFKGLKSPNFKSFAGVFNLPCLPGYFLAGTTDGVGTKAIPLIERSMFKTLAQDLVAMNLNDLICTGAKPLFFLDYVAVNKLNPEVLSGFVSELNEVLSAYNCALLGGETSEMPDSIKENVFDTAGFMVGLGKEDNRVDKKNVSAGDVVIGLKSSGAHSNGFSLIRKLYADKKISEEEFLETLAPTVIYANEVLELVEKGGVSAMANITGGGILENLSRAVPEGLKAVLDRGALPKISVFEKLKMYVDEDEMFRVFNMGVGFCLIVKPENLSGALKTLEKYEPFVFGRIEKSENSVRASFKD